MIFGQQLLNKRVLSAHPDDPHQEQDKRSHASRAAVFAEWLLKVFDEGVLRSTGGVLEVAGGRGELAFELAVKRQIPCTVLDPRCPGGGHPSAPWSEWRVSRPQRVWLKANCGLRSYAACQAYVASCPLRQCRATVHEAIEGTAATGAMTEASSSSAGTQTDASAGEQEPPSVTSALANTNTDIDPVQHEASTKALRHEKSSEVVVDLDSVEEKDQADVPPPPKAFAAMVVDHSSWADICARASVVVGLHPDQATGGVMELAQAIGRPFAVVPCCTFADDFPERQLADSKPVRTYTDLIDWLQQVGGPTTRKDFLPFVGKNLVVFQPPA